jgi:hypothetical protein
MADPVRLDPGQGTTFPSWAFGGTTTLWVKNEDGAYGGQASVNAGAGAEYVDVAPGDASSIQRQWGGIMVGVTNSGRTSLTVWTA